MDLLSHEEDEAAIVNTKPNVCLGCSCFFSSEWLGCWLNFLFAWTEGGIYESVMLNIPFSVIFGMITCLDHFAKTS